MTLNVTTFLIAMSIPSAFTGFCFWLIERKINKRDKRQEKKEAARAENEILLVKCVGACFALGEATARAIQDKKCNGEMSSALSHAKKLKHEQKDFFTEQGIQNIL